MFPSSAFAPSTKLRTSSIRRAAGVRSQEVWDYRSNSNMERESEAVQPLRRRGYGGGAPGPVCHLLGNDQDSDVLVHRIEPVAGGALLDPGSASRSGRALFPRWAIAGRAGLDP